ncbi:hypothetical protein BN7_2527 [Wickerhamomyces ciferrii]|uniref:Uncharacterized protein n=1 Tax=Wickerhamomyces ciferrii (strain ATCC 14091 / BCRC 22168 / CBS 111 / JCM 3599 / NBRC 0793 / NRRL Y-1031 F-60-10) TaxID=1206466 RepID=K0KJ38_WICCF|nr:uncharacterized protein BN7_2527 [Wickerhamomyces ciferrii]CCH42981.1 hypothetical protein BN7_2527 [Wickerhamomyces ciferrii]
MYSTLPHELQLNILSQSSDLQQVSHIDQHHYNLTQYIIQSKLQHYLTKTPLLLSLFSPNNKESNIKNFYNISYDVHSNYTSFQINNLNHKENLFHKDINTKPSVSLNQKNHLDLVLNEDQTTTKLSLNLIIGSQSFDTGFKLNKFKPHASQVKDGLKLSYSLQEGELEPAKGGYDYELNYNYSLNFQEIKIDNFELLRVLENDGGMILRY